MTARRPTLVSACLLGLRCRWNGEGRLDQETARQAAQEGFIAVCPEQLGGLSTPRCPAEIDAEDGDAVLCGKARVVDRRGTDVTAEFVRGAEETLRLALLYGVAHAVLTDGSPSCGVGYIRCRGRVVSGPGVTAALLIRHGIRVKGIEAEESDRDRN